MNETAWIMTHAGFEEVMLAMLSFYNITAETKELPSKHHFRHLRILEVFDTVSNSLHEASSVQVSPLGK